MVDADNVTQGLQLVEQQTDALLLLMKSEGLHVPAMYVLVSRPNSNAHTMISNASFTRGHSRKNPPNGGQGVSSLAPR